MAIKEIKSKIVEEKKVKVKDHTIDKHIEKVEQRSAAEEIKQKIEEEKKAKEDAVKRAKFIDIMEKDLRRFEGKSGWNLKRDEEIDESIPDVEVEADVPGLKEG